MEAHELDISIRPDGTVSIHVQGVKGAACEAYAKLFEEILNNTGEREHTAEYYEPATGIEIRLEQKA